MSGQDRAREAAVSEAVKFLEWSAQDDRNTNREKAAEIAGLLRMGGSRSGLDAAKQCQECGETLSGIPNSHNCKGDWPAETLSAEEWDLHTTLINACQLLDGWHQDGTAWSTWDEQVRKNVGRHLARLAASPSGANEVRPVAWMVTRDSECDPPEFFATEEQARKNACLGVVDTHVTPLFRRS